MRNINLHTFIIAMMFISTLTPAVHAACNSTLNQDVQTIIDNDRTKLNIPGLQVSILCPNESQPRDFVSGSIKIDSHIPVKHDNLFQVGSETKSFIAAILLQLETETILSLNDTLAKWLPFIPEKWKGITITQLLNHTSGIYDYTTELITMIHKNQLDLKKQWTANELISLAMDKPLFFEPGKGWHYSNTNYVLAGMIIEIATGITVAEQMHKRLLNPLNLNDTYFIPALYNNEILQRVSHGYSKSGLFPDEPKDITEVNHSWANAAGATISTTHDMAIWFKELLEGSILTNYQLQKLMSLVNTNNGQHIPDTLNTGGYGLGIEHDFATHQEESWWHSGGMMGYSSIMIWLKCNDIFITIHVNDITSIDRLKRRDINTVTDDVVSYIHNTSGMPQCRV